MKKVLIELLNHSPLKNEKLQFMVGVLDLSLDQMPTGIESDGTGPIIMSLVKDFPQTTSSGTGAQFKNLVKSV